MTPGRRPGGGGAYPPRGGARTGAVPEEERPPVWVVRVRLPDHLERPTPAMEARIARDIVECRDGDFATSTSASRDLLGLGEVAVPYLGYAAEEQETPPAHALVRISILVQTILRDVPSPHLDAHLRSPHEVVQAATCAACAERAATEHAPAIVELLDHASVDLRRAAVAALRRLSNEFFGYRPAAPPTGREAATASWRAFWGLPPTR